MIKNYRYFVTLMLPKRRTCLKGNDGQSKWIYFQNENDDLLGHYNTIWDKTSADIKKKLIGILSTIKHF